MPHNDEISLVDIWRVLRRYRLTVLGIMLAAAFVSGTAALLITPKYRAEVLLAPVTDFDDKQNFPSSLGEFGNLAVLAGIKLDHKDRKIESVATLRSRRFTENFIEQNKLLPVLFPHLWDEQRGDWNTDLVPGEIPTLWDAYYMFSENVRHVREDRVTGLVTLSVEWRSPQVAAQWANDLVAAVNTTLREKAVETSNQAIAYLREQLAVTSVVDLQQVLHRLIEAEMKKIILANINEEYAFKVIDPAVAPEEPFRPKLLPMVVLGLLLGLVAGMATALVMNAVTSAKTGREEPAAPRPLDSPPR